MKKGKWMTWKQARKLGMKKRAPKKRFRVLEEHWNGMEIWDKKTGLTYFLYTKEFREGMKKSWQRDTGKDG